MKYLIIALLFIGCQKDVPPYSGPGDPGTGGSIGGGAFPPDNQFTITVRFYSSDSLLAQNCVLTVDDGADIPIRYCNKLPHCRDEAFESVTLMQDIEYVFRIMDYDNNKVIDTFHFKEPRNGYACMSFDLKK